MYHTTCKYMEVSNGERLTGPTMPCPACQAKCAQCYRLFCMGLRAFQCSCYRFMLHISPLGITRSKASLKVLIHSILIQCFPAKMLMLSGYLISLIFGIFVKQNFEWSFSFNGILSELYGLGQHLSLTCCRSLAPKIHWGKLMTQSHFRVEWVKAPWALPRPCPGNTLTKGMCLLMLSATVFIQINVPYYPYLAPGALRKLKWNGANFGLTYGTLQL